MFEFLKKSLVSYGGWTEKTKGKIILKKPFAPYTIFAVDSSYHAPFPPELIYQGRDVYKANKIANCNLKKMGWHDEIVLYLFEYDKLIKKITT